MSENKEVVTKKFNYSPMVTGGSYSIITDNFFVADVSAFKATEALKAAQKYIMGSGGNYTADIPYLPIHYPLGITGEPTNWTGTTKLAKVSSMPTLKTDLFLPVLTPIDPDSLKLPRFYRLANNSFLHAKPADTIWINTVSKAVMHFYSKTSNFSGYNSKGGFDVFLELKLTDVINSPEWEKVAEGLPIVELTLPDLDKHLDLTLEQFLTYISQSTLDNGFLSYGSTADYNGIMDNQSVRYLLNYYHNVRQLKEKYAESLTPNQKGLATKALKFLYSLYAITYATKFIDDSSLRLEVESILDTTTALFGDSEYKDAKKSLSKKVNASRQTEMYGLECFLEEMSHKQLYAKAMELGCENAYLYSKKRLMWWVADTVGMEDYSGLSSVSNKIIDKAIKFLDSNSFVFDNVPSNKSKKEGFGLYKEDLQKIYGKSDGKFYFAGFPVNLPANFYAAVNSSKTKLRVYDPSAGAIEEHSSEAGIVVDLPYLFDFSAQKTHELDVASGWIDVTSASVNGEDIFVSSKLCDFWCGVEFGSKNFTLSGLISTEVLEGDSSFISTNIVDLLSSKQFFSSEEIVLALSTRESVRKVLASLKDKDFFLEPFLMALKYLLSTGELVPDNATIWHSKAIGKDFIIPAGQKVYAKNDYTLYIQLSDSYVVAVDTYTGNFLDVVSVSSDTVSNFSELFVAPDNSAIDMAFSEGWYFSEEAFDKVAQACSVECWTNTEVEENASAYMTKLAFEAWDDVDPNYAALVGKMFFLPVGVKQLVLQAAIEHDVDTLSVVVWKVSKKAFAVETFVEKISSEAVYFDVISKGIIQASNIIEHWSVPCLDAFIDDFHLVINPLASVEEKAVAISAKILELKKASAIVPSGDATKDTAHLVLSPIDKQYGGMHTKQGYADQYGEEWMAKYYQSDNYAQYRCDAEHYGNVIGRTFGFDNPQSFVRTVDGKYNVLQKIMKNKGSLNHLYPKDLSTPLLTSIMCEHVLDWFISNHDSWGENLLISPYGNKVIGIDKGQAFKHHHDDALEIGYLPEENPIPVWYDRFYEGILNKSISYDTALTVARKVLLRAFQVQEGYQLRTESLISAALEKRNFWPSGYTKESFTKKIIDRKATLLLDFYTLYEQLFTAAGYEWKFSLDSFSTQLNGIHLQNSFAFVDEILNSSAFGKSLFFNSEDIEDAHIVWSKMQQLDGGVKLLGFGKIRQTADGKLTAWMKARIAEKKVSAEMSQIAGKKMSIAVKESTTHKAFFDYTTQSAVEVAGRDNQLQSGKEFVVSYGNVTISYRPWTDLSVALAQQGYLCIDIANWDGQEEAIDDVLNTLSLLGVDVSPADSESLELFYWQHLSSVIKDRVIMPQTQSIIKEIEATLDMEKMTNQEKLVVFKTAWKNAYSEEMVEKAQWLPQFNTHKNLMEGRPYWVRPDFTLEKLRTIYNDTLPSHWIHNSGVGTSVSTLRILQTGNLLSTEERPRVLSGGIFGSSSDSDQVEGSSAFVFTRQSYYPGEYFVVLDPRISLRTSTYAYSSDYYGKLSARSSYAHFKPETMFSWGNSSNEMMVKNACPIVACVVPNLEKKSQLVTKLISSGYSMVQGIKAESFVYSQDEWNKVYDKFASDLWDKLLKE